MKLKMYNVIWANTREAQKPSVYFVKIIEVKEKI